MKKIYTLVSAALIGTFAFAQSQRLILTEEFTQASCGPCAVANPSFNTMLDNNTTKVISIKYQTSWPGVDPMNAQNAAEINSRTSTYYAVTGVPDGKQDGVDFYPGSYSQSMINNEYVIPSPFTLNISHTLNNNMDSAFITCVITCTQNVTMTTPKFQLAMIERHIAFTSAPGSNGEKDFYNVMRKMYPNQNGTAIATSWTNSQTQTLTFAVKIPTYIYQLSQLGFVGWIQDDANKNVKQAGYSAPLPSPIDAGVSATSGVSTSCSTTATPIVTLENFGTSTLTSCTINYQINNNPVQMFNWTGSVAPMGNTQVTLPSVTGVIGTNVFIAYTSNPNSLTDMNTLNDKSTTRFMILNSATNPFPVAEPFTNSTFPPTNWLRFNPDNGPMWLRMNNVGAYSQAPLGAARMDFVNSIPGNIDELFMPNTDMTAVTANNAWLTFDVAYAPGIGYNDTLYIMGTSDCGANWTQLYYKYGSNLATAPATGSPFTPTASQWRHEAIDMSAFAGQGSVIVKFSARSDYGNYLYIDNVNLSSTNSVIDLSSEQSAVVYPNPVNGGDATLNINLSDNENVSYSILNLLGETIFTSTSTLMNSGEHKLVLNFGSLNAGIYFVKVNAGIHEVNRKVVIEK